MPESGRGIGLSVAGIRSAVWYFPTEGSQEKLQGVLRKLAVRRGLGRLKRVQFIGDGASWLQKIWDEVFRPNESACKMLVAARCKLAGMHWRHQNAAAVALLRATLRSNFRIVVCPYPAFPHSPSYLTFSRRRHWKMNHGKTRPCFSPNSV